MKIAFVALPLSDDSAAQPPLPLCYAAAILEQQRHIVRIYDLAVRGSNPHGDPLASLRAFRPHLVAITPGDAAAAPEIIECAAEWHAHIALFAADLRTWGEWEGNSILCPRDGSEEAKDVEKFIQSALTSLSEPLDRLPFPARHLLALEEYHLYTLDHELQTPLLIGRRHGSGSALRNPALIISEMRSVAHEHGVLHFSLDGAPLTYDAVWLRVLLQHLSSARLGVSWEGSAAYEVLTPELLRSCKDAGCEALRFSFDAMTALDEKSARDSLSRAVDLAHDLDMKVRANILLEPRFSSVPMLVDISATFGLDDVRFQVMPREETAPDATTQPGSEAIAELAQARYQSSRSRQYFIDRFGARLGPVIWRVGRTGLLGRSWQQAAVSGEAAE